MRPSITTSSRFEEKCKVRGWRGGKQGVCSRESHRVSESGRAFDHNADIVDGYNSSRPGSFIDDWEDRRLLAM